MSNSYQIEKADMAVTGIPFDTATTNRPGARFGPCGIRAVSTEVSWQKKLAMRV